MNRLTLYSRKYLKPARPFCTDYNYYNEQLYNNNCSIIYYGFQIPVTNFK